MTRLFQLLAAAILGAVICSAQAQAPGIIKTERFDHDPGWEGFNNRVEPTRIPTVTQDFGWTEGRIGGRVTRAAKPAFYAEKIVPKTLNDKLTASGTFALSASSAGSGMFFGWFNARQPGGGGRPMNSLGFDFDGEGRGGRLAVRLISGSNKSCGTFVTPFIPGKFRPTPIKNDGTRYHWKLDYDPQANDEKGRFQVTIKSDSAKPESFEGKVFSVDLPDGFKQDNATFDRFGLMNMMKPGAALTIHFSDLDRDGVAADLKKDPGWEGSGNHASYEDRDRAGAHNFGFSPDSNFAGGSPGEIGGNLWRSGHYAYYADRVGPLTLNDRLEAGGKVVLLVGAPDSDVYLGWFNSANQEKPPAQAGHFVGVHIGGPTRVGHYFDPAYATARGVSRHASKGPVLVPGKPCEWSLIYDPAGNNGLGEIRATLAGEAITLPLKPGDKSAGATLDHFGLFTSDIGGQMVRIFLDDLKYTAHKAGE
jgi:hypothetical protein